MLINPLMSKCLKPNKQRTKEKEKERASQPATRPKLASPAGLPTPSLFPTHACGPRARVGPACRPSLAPRARVATLSCSHCPPSPTCRLSYSSSSRPRINRPRDRGPTALAGVGLGVTPRAWPLFPLALRSRNLMPPSDASRTFPPHDADRHWRHGAWL